MSRPTLALDDRRTQRARVVGALHEQRKSRTDLVEQFGVSSSLITRLVRSLIDDGILRELGTQAQAIGRPPVRLEVVRDHGALLAVSCTSEGLRARCVNLHGGIIAETRAEAIDGVISPESIGDAIAALIERTPRVLGIGVAVPGVVDAETGDVSAAPDIGWTEEVPLRSMLRERFGVVVTIDNDVNLMMASERRTLDERASRNAVYLYLGTRGIGAGIIAGGRLIEGDHGAAGEIGLSPLSATDRTDFEDTTSTLAIASRLEAAGHTVDAPAVDRLLALADDGDAAALRIRADVLAAFSHAIAVITTLLDPHVILLGGHARSFRESERSAMLEALRGELPFLPDIRSARPKPDAVLDSALNRCWQQLLAGGL
ncbi:putative NBD/HSP70 family sugar kinase [Microbacterium sp. W4I4]|uniref:ROK family transcriptional regulator n=1 Tax=Microbacterium sp. W4I4 TaxID=3042295 RepID=UPI0027804108|nr:ROK family transcriptional regulator [Microbacterium sp. W4I4]MDQ0614757.1 putative NBD/HSP70 family sugar kinase [Microbacterium sp. W4I4]